MLCFFDPTFSRVSSQRMAAAGYDIDPRLNFYILFNIFFFFFATQDFIEAVVEQKYIYKCSSIFMLMLMCLHFIGYVMCRYFDTTHRQQLKRFGGETIDVSRKEFGRN